ncbi:MAG: peptide-methionine (S)-S-oxide reductase MsrA [Gammaproteobacteria bacterium]|jgi:peptide-methionine (S)-S-oxide reductase|nr:peptide-methionine (S)-S-oxide reductase MsrA [Gammaproteobacteria bacterium]
MAQTATFGAGCFWGVEALFAKQPGVKQTSVGYMGGTLPNPSYQAVCTGQTQHVEVVQIDFDEQTISYADLLQLFWQHHDPTTINRQGPDIGSQYRSVVFYHSEQQRQEAELIMAQWQQSGCFAAPIVTVIEPAQDYYLAEDYHQQYLAKRHQSHT